MNSAESTFEDLLIPASIYTKMERHVRREAPLEACGILGGLISRGVRQAEWIHPARNQLKSPLQYQIDPAEQLKAFEYLENNGLELVAIYHSHPAGPGHPSALDIKRLYYPEAVQLIWSPERKTNSGKIGLTAEWICRGYMIEEGQVREIHLLICQ